MEGDALHQRFDSFLQVNETGKMRIFFIISDHDANEVIMSEDSFKVRYAKGG